MMRSYLPKIFLTIACLALIAMPLPVGAQSSDVGLSIRVMPGTTSPGTNVAFSGLVTNNTSKKMRTELTVTSLAPCGGETTIGFVKVALEPGQTKFVSGAYSIPADACLGMYTVTLSAEMGGGNGPASAATVDPSASAFLEVK